MGDADDRRLLDEQIAYYRARASEYDATSTPDGDPFASIFEPIRMALNELTPSGRVLELAAGTGQWTATLARHAAELTVTDASPEMLAINAGKLDDPGITYRVLDAFALEPDPTWDVVFFGFFLSHVPRTRFESFWDGVRGLLAPGGSVLFVDEAAAPGRAEEWADGERDVVWRTLTDGTRHRAVKVLWRPSDLQRRLGELGWDASIAAAEPFFFRGTAMPRSVLLDDRVMPPTESEE